MVRAVTESISTEESTACDAGPAAGVRWDLSDLYGGAGDAAIDADLSRALDLAGAFADRYRGQVANLDAGGMAEAIDALEALQEHPTRAAIYAGLLFAADTANPAHGALLQRVQERISEIRNTLVFLELEWVAVDDERVRSLLSDPVLASRRHLLESMRRYRPHLLSEPEERLLEETANTGERAWSRLFDEILGEARFQIEIDGKKTELGEEEALSLLYGPDRETRRNAARGLTAGLRQHSRTLAFIFNTLVQDKAVRDRLRRYQDPIDSRNLANEIDGASVRALLDACERGHPLAHRYYRLKAQLLGIDQLEDYDRYAPVGDAAGNRSFEEAQRIVLGAFGDFAPAMAEVAARFFAKGWIDAELRPGKRSGAFSASTVPSLHPYVLLNFTGNLRDVMTVAHELGHGVHQYLARERGLFEQDTPLTTAETASVFGEMLVFRRLMQEEQSPKVRLALLCGKLEDTFATVFRQVAMTRFEEKLHAARRGEGELPIPRINELWMETNRPMLGDAVHLTDDYAWWWLYIPHFVHSPFYCYAYAFGELLVLALLRRYDEEGAVFVPRYLDLLRAGGSDTPPALLERVGLDITNPAFWDGGLALIEELLNEAETLAGELRD
jgi:oligoendopeptidase F